MKSPKTLILFLLSLSFCKANGSESSLQENSATKNIHLSHDQYMVTYVGAEVNDVVGVFDAWYPTQDTTSGSFSYSLINSKSGTYALNSSTGIITINSSAGLVKGTDKLTVRTTLRGITQDNFIYIKVKAISDCYFINPAAGSNGNGTKSSPYNNWSNVSFAAGKAYFQKRGTTNATPIVISTNGTQGNEVILGAYGTGNRPIINSGPDKIGMQVFASYIWIFEYEYVNNLFGIETETGNQPYQHCLFSDLAFNGNVSNGQLYIKRHGEFGDNDMRHKIYDITAYNGGCHGVKVEGGTCNVENVRTYNNYAQGISFPSWGDHDTISGISTHDNGQAGMELSGRHQIVSYSYFKNEYRGIVVDDPQSYSSIISHCLVNESSGLFGIIIRGYNSPSDLFARDFIIEDCEVKNITASGIAGIAIGFAVKNVTLRRNYLHNNSVGIEIGAENVSVDTVNINYNVMHSNTTDILGSAGNRVYIYNNTSDGTIDCAGSSNVTARNNFYKTMKGVGTSSNNIDINGIKTSNYFNNYPGHNYMLKSTATDALEKGMNVGLTQDFAGNPVMKLPNIGAYENTSVLESANHAPVINDQTFTITSANKNSFTAKILATDPDAGQVLTYSISSGNDAGIFAINSITGTLTCNPGKINFNNHTIYSLTVLVKDNGNQILSDNSTVKIEILPDLTTFYIDPLNINDQNENGSMEHPYNSWSDIITWKEGATYLQKRNTTAYIDQILIGAGNITIDTYGEGTPAAIISESAEYVFRAFEKSNITIRNLHITAHKANSCIYFLGSTSDLLKIEKCTLEGSSIGIRVIDGKNVQLSFNTFIDNSEGISSYAKNTFVNYNIFMGNSTAINIAGNLSTALIYNNVFYDNAQGISNSYSSLTLYNNIFYLTNGNDIALNDALDNLVSDNNIFYPEQAGFIRIGKNQYGKLYDYQQANHVDQNSYSQDPGFVAANTGDFNLQASSPAVNTGKFIENTQDFLGNAVPHDKLTDIGAFEFTGIPSQPPQDQELILYPNPSSGMVTVTLGSNANKKKSTEKSQVQVHDMMGKMVLYKNLFMTGSEILENLDLAALPKGLYTVILTIGKANFSSMLSLY